MPLSRNKMSESQEDYLEAILWLRQEKGRARVGEIARHLKVKEPSVTGAVTQLSRMGLVRHEPYRGVELTPRGTALAREILARHRKLARFLKEVLQVDPERAEGEACRIEHAMSRETWRRFERFLEGVFAAREVGEE